MGVTTGRPKGRPPGAKNKRTMEAMAAAEEAAARMAAAIPGAFPGDAHALLMMVYKDPAYEMVVRLDAAKAAIRFEKPSLAAVTQEMMGADGGPVRIEAIRRVIIDPKPADG